MLWGVCGTLDYHGGRQLKRLEIAKPHALHRLWSARKVACGTAAFAPAKSHELNRMPSDPPLQPMYTLNS